MKLTSINYESWYRAMWTVENLEQAKALCAMKWIKEQKNFDFESLCLAKIAANDECAAVTVLSYDVKIERYAAENAETFGPDCGNMGITLYVWAHVRSAKVDKVVRVHGSVETAWQYSSNLHNGPDLLPKVCTLRQYGRIEE